MLAAARASGAPCTGLTSIRLSVELCSLRGRTLEGEETQISPFRSQLSIQQGGRHLVPSLHSCFLSGTGPGGCRFHGEGDTCGPALVESEAEADISEEDRCPNCKLPRAELREGLTRRGRRIRQNPEAQCPGPFKGMFGFSCLLESRKKMSLIILTV